MLSEDERRELRAWRSRQAFFMFVLLTLVLPGLVAMTIFAVREPAQLFDGSLGLSLLSFAGLAIFLVRAPFRWRQARRDEAGRVVRSVRGHADVRSRRGIGLIAPTHETLHISGERFALAPFWREQITPGLVYEVRFAPESRAILSISLAENVIPTARPEALPPHVRDLTERDRHLIRLLARGLTDKDIARQLNLSPTTVRTYNSELYLKLGIARRGEVRALAERFGLLDEAESRG
ncbi:LuxR C-terminal-related transcriptional regulator [uncultured Maricaulis sp.]|uniref:helix-turn-helix transcriptional regulator n=1 Tax=uncultured Maricaulis sp. TaxID=174710 RepID=UPI0030D93306